MTQSCSDTFLHVRLGGSKFPIPVYIKYRGLLEQGLRVFVVTKSRLIVRGRTETPCLSMMWQGQSNKTISMETQLNWIKKFNKTMTLLFIQQSKQEKYSYCIYSEPSNWILDWPIGNYGKKTLRLNLNFIFFSSNLLSTRILTPALINMYKSKHFT